jgi:glutathionylspermidine synthase
MIAEAPARVRDVELVPLRMDAEYRRRVIFECFKWDPQVGDADTIGDHACVLSAETATKLSRLAEALAAETVAMEEALLRRPDLHAELGVRGKLRRVLAGPVPAERTSVRVMRFDFHPSEDGWSLSEVNSDVPGGFAEASALPALAAERTPMGRPGGDVAGALVAAVAARVEAGAWIALVHATAYSDDRQVMQYLASRFAEAGLVAALLAPDHLRWSQGRASSIAEGQEGPVAAVVRFFPADWLPALPGRDWRGYFSSRLVMCNPPSAALSQTKRLPVVWDRLGVDVSTWRSVLPETRDPREAPWRTDEGWLLKPALGRVGEGVAWRGVAPETEWRKMARDASLWPRSWIAQRRFRSRALAGRDGPRHLCVGVFTVDGKAAGFYGRLSSRTIIEKHAQDVAVLVAA